MVYSVGILHELFVFIKFPHFLTPSAVSPVYIRLLGSEEIVRK
jgi:hypothetical protein